MQSSKNSWQQIFGGIYLNSHSTNIKYLEVWSVSSFDSVIDGLSMLPESFKSVYWGEVMVNTTSSGRMTVTPYGMDKHADEFFGSPTNWNTSYLSNDVWAELVRMPAYRLLPDVYDCDSYVGQSRVFAMQATDRLGTKSNTVFVTMVISTAGFIFTDDAITITSNDVTVDVIMTDRAFSNTRRNSPGNSLNVSYGGIFSSASLE